jgi:hypothetical protein
MEGINNKIKTMLRKTYGLRDELFLKLKLYSLHHSRLELLVFRCTIIWEKIIVITREKWTEDIVIIRERLEPRVA